MTPDKKLKPLLLEAIAAAADIEKSKDKYGWRGSVFEPARKLQPDNRGVVGESFVAAMLGAMGKKVQHTGRTDPQNKQWDIVADGVRLEVKFATMGMSSPTFQHEHIEKERQYEGIVFVDIAPDEIYVTCVAKRDIDWNKLHRRREGIHYKWDWNRAKLKGREMRTLADFASAYEEMEKRILAERKKRVPRDEI